MSSASYRAMSEAVAMPPSGYEWSPAQTRRWVESLERQVASLQERLREEAIARGKCRSNGS